MGRAAAVRAATKSKTDAKKAKTNALYGKKVSQGKRICGLHKMFSPIRMISSLPRNSLPSD